MGQKGLDKGMVGVVIYASFPMNAPQAGGRMAKITGKSEKERKNLLTNGWQRDRIAKFTARA